MGRQHGGSTPSPAAAAGSAVATAASAAAAALRRHLLHAVQPSASAPTTARMVRRQPPLVLAKTDPATWRPEPEGPRPTSNALAFACLERIHAPVIVRPLCCNGEAGRTTKQEAGRFREDAGCCSIRSSLPCCWPWRRYTSTTDGRPNTRSFATIPF